MAEPNNSVIRGKVQQWGDALGIRINRSEAARLGIEVGQDARFRILRAEGQVDISHVRTLNDGQGTDEHDRILGEGRRKALDESRA